LNGERNSLVDVDLGISLVATAANRGFARAAGALRKHFLEVNHSGPVRCASFALAGQSTTEDFQSRQRQIMEQMITVGRARLE